MLLLIFFLEMAGAIYCLVVGVSYSSVSTQSLVESLIFNIYCNYSRLCVFVCDAFFFQMDEWVEKNLYKMLYQYSNDDIRWVMDDLQADVSYFVQCCLREFVFGDIIRTIK